MNWTELLKSEIESAFRATEGLVALVDKDKLNWKPATGANWMTTGQLLKHLETSCGAMCKGFLTGDWGMPADASPDEMLPPADKLPAATSLAETKKAIAADKKLALGMVVEAGEKNLANKQVAAPWDPTVKPLGQQMLECAKHLASHKSQLFYYLKLQGKPVNTMTLWGMG